MPNLSLTLQTGTLYASGDASTFTGTGGPWGFSPFTSQFGGTVSSAGLAREPFNDTVYSVAPGDEVIFVVAFQNMTAAAQAFDVGLRAAIPAGFVVPADGTNLTVTDGTGVDLAFTGDLFGTGLRLSGPVAGYDPDSGRNVVLATYTLAAGAALPGPYASVISTATLTHAATVSNGPDAGAVGTASTNVLSAAPTPLVQAETSPVAVAKGQTIAFDISVAIPAGTMRDLRLDTVLPPGSASLRLVSTTITSIGSALAGATPVVGSDGSVRFGTFNTIISSGGDPAQNTVTLRVVVQADGTASGPAVLQTVLSAATTDPAVPRWMATVGNAVGVVVPPAPPGIAGIWAGQAATPGLALHPLAGLVLTDNNPAGTATLAVTLRDPSLGRLSGANPAQFDAAGAAFVLSGPLATLQAAARQLVFTPAAAGTEQFNVTLLDPAGGIAQDSGTQLTVAGAASDAVVTAPSTPLSLVDLHGTVVFRPGVALTADHVSGVPLLVGMGDTDRLLLPGTAPTLGFSQAGGTATLVVGGTTLLLLGIYDPSWFTVAQAGPGMLSVGIRPDPLFDPAFYLARNPDVAAAGVDPFQHFLISGWKEGRAPLALFDPAYYLSHNPDVAAAGVNPLLHFESMGWREGRDPSAAFSERDYLAANTDVLAARLDPLLHYVLYGHAEGRPIFAVPTGPIDPLIDPTTYYANNPDVRAAGANANAHYLNSGWHEGRNPDPWFDTRYYLTQNPDVRAAGIDPLVHFELIGWAEGRQPSLLFDDARYLDANPDVRAAGVNPLLHFIQFGQAAGRLPILVGGTAAADPLVNAAFYDRQLGATLLPTGPAAEQQAAWSYAATGWQRGLSPDAWFDTQYYLARNPDVAAAHISPLAHYETFGWKEGRDPSAQFSLAKYTAANPDVQAAGLEPLRHYVLYGMAEGRLAYPV